MGHKSRRSSSSARRGINTANPKSRFYRQVASSLENVRRDMFGEKLLLEHDPVRNVYDTLRQQLYNSTVKIQKPVAPWARNQPTVIVRLGDRRRPTTINRGPLYKMIVIKPAGSVRNTPAVGQTLRTVQQQQIGYDPMGPLDDIIECVERHRRREVLFALRKTGKGGARNDVPHYNDDSQVDC